MKKNTFILVTFLFSNFAHAAILRCNKDANGPNIYATAQAAHDAATAGDTIHLEPTQFGNYGTLNISKKIILMSTGDFIAQNPNTQAFSYVGACGDISLNTGAENSLISAKVTGSISVFVGNVSIVHTRADLINIWNGNGLPMSNIIVSKCYLNIVYVNSVYGLNPPFISNVIITNNFIAQALVTTEGTSANIEYNTITCSSGSYGTSIYNSSVNRNIFIGVSIVPTFINGTVSNNISDVGPFSPVGSNQNIVDLSTVFQNWGVFNGDNYQLLSSYSNQDLGMYGGTDPYRQACQPRIPAIYQLSIPSSLNSNTLPIQVSTKANN